MATFSLLRIPTETRSLSGVSKWKDLPTWSDTWSLCVVFVRATLILIAVFVGAWMVFDGTRFLARNRDGVLR